MKKISKHLEIYLVQKESLFSILGRISINATVLLYPLIYILEDYLLYFLYKWLFILILIYHVVYGVKKLLAADLGIISFIALCNGIVAYLHDFDEYDYSSSQLFIYYMTFHISVGVGSLFTDYLLSDLEELTFFDFERFWQFVVILSISHFVWFAVFWYF